MLEEMLASVRGQDFAEWELCLWAERECQPRVREALDRVAGRDSRIRVAYGDEGGAAVAEALVRARGNFLALLGTSIGSIGRRWRPSTRRSGDPGDRLRLHRRGRDRRRGPPFGAVLQARLVAGAAPGRDVHGPAQRPAAEVSGGGGGRLRPGARGRAADWDLVLRVTERAREVLHVPRILYHRRVLGRRRPRRDEHPGFGRGRAGGAGPLRADRAAGARRGRPGASRRVPPVPGARAGPRGSAS